VTDENGKGAGSRVGRPGFSLPQRDRRGRLAQLGSRNAGIYFIVPDDQRHTDSIQVHEPFEHNVGWKKGARKRKTGKGRWMFVGLGLWRQVAAGTDGAFQLLANLTSRGKTPVSSRDHKFDHRTKSP
jgi:hypothetical protein